MMMNRRSYDLMKPRPSDTACQWSSQSYSLGGITKSFALPMVIRSDARSCSLAAHDSRLKLAEQPILLYGARTKHKMVASHLQFDVPRLQNSKEQNNRSAGGEQLIIPEDYPGWFVFLKSVAGGIKCFQSVQEVFSSKVRAFVTGSKVSGMQVTTEQEGRVEYKPRHFLPGTVFRADRIYVGKMRVQVGMKFLLFRKTKLQDVKYLKCYDVQNREILLAISQIGKFFEISPVFVSQSDNEKYVFNTEELFSLRQIISPVMLIYGQAPRVENFSGILHLQRKFLDSTVVAATNDERGQQVVLEIALTSASTFHLALNSKHVIKHGNMGAALKHCKHKSDQFVQRIRVPLAMSQQRNESADSTGETDDRRLDSITESADEETKNDSGDDNTNKTGSDVTYNHERRNSPDTSSTAEDNNGNKEISEHIADYGDNNDEKEMLLKTDNDSYCGKAKSVLGQDDVFTGNVTDDETVDDKEGLLKIDKDSALDKEEAVFQQDVSLEDERVPPIGATSENLMNYINNSWDSQPEHSNSVNSSQTDEDDVVTVTVEEKLINLESMAEILLSTSTTTTTTTMEVRQGSINKTTGGMSDNSTESDSDADKMSDSDSHDDTDSGISEKNNQTNRILVN